MRRRLFTIAVWFVIFPLSLILETASYAEAGPTFVPIPDTTVCEGEYLILVIYADTDYPEDVLEFEIENAPQGIQFAVYGKCG